MNEQEYNVQRALGTLACTACGKKTPVLYNCCSCNKLVCEDCYLPERVKTCIMCESKLIFEEIVMEKVPEIQEITDLLKDLSND